MTVTRASTGVPATGTQRHEGLRLARGTVHRDRVIEVRYPYTGTIVATVPKATAADVRGAIGAAAAYRCPLDRRERHTILLRARRLLARRRQEWARRITLESGLCLKDTVHEVERAGDVLLFAAVNALVDDGQAFAGDSAVHSRARRVFTLREPLLGVIVAITPFNHPLNQVVHKVAPAVATGNRVVLKPSEKTPLSALALADLLYEAGLPREMLQVVTGDVDEIGAALVDDARVELVSFTGSTAVGQRIARRAAPRRLLLELGGVDPAIVLDDAALAEAAAAIARGAYGNAGQRCTAVKRVLVQDGVAEEFRDALLAATRRLQVGDPLDPDTDVGTLIDVDAARRVEAAVDRALDAGATVLHGHRRDGPQYPPTLVDGVSPGMELVTREVFGPVAPLVRVQDDADAVRTANASNYALSAGVFTASLERALWLVSRLHAGSVNVGEVGGYRLECTPFGGIKDSGLGHKEGVLEAMKAYTNLKTYSLPWPS